MFYILSKVLYFIINPLTWILVLLFIAFFTKKNKRRKRTLGAAICLLLFFTNPFLFKKIAQWWEISPITMSEITEPYDVAIVLGGYSKPGVVPDDRFHLRSAVTRLSTAVELYQSGKVKKLLLSGGEVGITHKIPSEAIKAQEFLINIGVDSADIIIENQARNTHENAKYSAQLIKANDYNKVLLITSAYHMRRSSACLNKEEISHTPFSVDLFDAKLDSEIFNQFLPKIAIFFYWEAIIREWFGMLTYKAMGYM